MKAEFIALLLLIEDYCVFKDGGNSLFDWSLGVQM